MAIMTGKPLQLQLPVGTPQFPTVQAPAKPVIPNFQIAAFQDPGYGNPFEGWGESLADLGKAVKPVPKKKKELADLKLQLGKAATKGALREARLSPEEKLARDLAKLKATERVKMDIQLEGMGQKIDTKARYEADKLKSVHENDLNLLRASQQGELEKLREKGAQDQELANLKQKHEKELLDFKRNQERDLMRFSQTPPQEMDVLDPHKPQKYIYLNSKFQQNPEYKEWLGYAYDQIGRLEQIYLGDNSGKEPGRLAKARDMENLASRFKKINKDVSTGGLINKAWNTAANWKGSEDVRNLMQIATELMLRNKPPGLGAMSEGEWVILGNSTLSLDNPAEVNNRIADKMIQVAKADQDYWAFYQTLSDKYGPPDAASTVTRLWTKYTRDNPYFVRTEEDVIEPNQDRTSWEDYFGDELNLASRSEQEPGVMPPDSEEEDVNGGREMTLIQSDEDFDKLPVGARFKYRQNGETFYGRKEEQVDMEPKVLPPSS